MTPATKCDLAGYLAISLDVFARDYSPNTQTLLHPAINVTNPFIQLQFVMEPKHKNQMCFKSFQNPRASSQYHESTCIFFYYQPIPIIIYGMIKWDIPN